MRTDCVSLLAARRLRGFLTEERGEIAPATYLATLPIALLFIFFALDVGLRKGARLVVEHAALCAARSAAVYMPAPTGGCTDAQAYALHAAAACLAPIASKRGLRSPEDPGTLSELVKRAEARTRVVLSGSCQHGGVITATVTYQYGPMLPFSPLGPVSITASAQSMLQTIK